MTKIALVHDSLCGMGGAERVFKYICQQFPDADIYTLAYRKDLVDEYFSTRKILTTWMQPFMFNMAAVRWLFPINMLVMNSLNLSQYDLVISSSASIAKYVKTDKKAHICYCYFPTRAIWNTDSYFGTSRIKLVFKLFLPLFKWFDFRSAQRVDHFIAISEEAQKWIGRTYNRKSDIISCPIDTKHFKDLNKRRQGFLLVSRLEKWKKVDYAVEAFNANGLALTIVGEGTEKDALVKAAKKNITFLGQISDSELLEQYSSAEAVIFTPELEYGLIPVEANACGTPVICLGKAGVRETMIPVNEVIQKGLTPTALFFYEQNATALIEALEDFSNIEFNSAKLVEHASQFSIERFQEKIAGYTNQKLL